MIIRNYILLIFFSLFMLNGYRLMSQPEKVFTGTKNKRASDLYNQSAVLMMEGRNAEAEQ